MTSFSKVTYHYFQDAKLYILPNMCCHGPFHAWEDSPTQGSWEQEFPYPNLHPPKNCCLHQEGSCQWHNRQFLGAKSSQRKGIQTRLGRAHCKGPLPPTRGSDIHLPSVPYLAQQTMQHSQACMHARDVLNMPSSEFFLDVSNLYIYTATTNTYQTSGVWICSIVKKQFSYFSTTFVACPHKSCPSTLSRVVTEEIFIDGFQKA